MGCFSWPSGNLSLLFLEGCCNGRVGLNGKEGGKKKKDNWQ